MSERKTEIRQRMLALRRAQDKTLAREKSASIVESLQKMPAYQEAQNVALYWPMMTQGEVDTRPLDADLRRQGKRIYYPVFSRSSENCSGFAVVEDPKELTLSARGFREPAGRAERAALSALDLIVVPAVAASPRGERIGFGSGFYDRILPQVRASTRTFILVFQFQIEIRLPVENHDVRCNAVLTEHGLIIGSPGLGA